jgi:tetratricopeptide (TPR) repeat protein
VVSPTGVIYPPGTPPRATRYSETARLYHNQGRFDRAASLALEGIETDPANPIHYFLAGSAYSRLGRYEDAHDMFSEAQRIYPAYDLDVEPERQSAWAEAFNAGLQAYASGDIEGTIRSWEQAVLIYDLQPEAHRNLAILLAQEGRYEEAIDVYRRGVAGLTRRPATRVLEERELRRRDDARITMEENLAEILLFTGRFDEAEPLLRRQLEREPSDVQLRSKLAAALSGQGRDDEATAIYRSLLSGEALEATELLKVGAAFFRSAHYVEAGEAFRRLTELQPDSRDAWFNYVNCLFAAEAWETLASAVGRLIELDPLGENIALIAARAHLETGNESGAASELKRIDAAPVHVAELRLQPSGLDTRVQGRVTGGVAEPGTPVRLRFTFYGDVGALGTETITLSAPPSGESTSLEVAFEGRVAAYRYELIR